MGTMGRISALSATFPHVLPLSLKAPWPGGRDLTLIPRAWGGLAPLPLASSCPSTSRSVCSASTLAPTLCGLCRSPPCRPTPPAEAQRLPYYATYCPTRLLIHSMCTSHYLDIFITSIICLNVVTMSLEHYNQPTVSLAWPLARDRVAGLGPQQDPAPGMGWGRV